MEEEVEETRLVPAPRRGVLDVVEGAIARAGPRRRTVLFGTILGAGALAALSPASPLTVALAVGAMTFLGELLVGQRYWIYLRWGRPDLALRAVEAILAGIGNVPHANDYRLVAASIHFSMNDLAGGKAALSRIEPTLLSTALNRCWYFLLQADLFRRLGDQDGLHAMIDAAEAMDAEDGSGLIRPMIEMARAMEALGRGDLDLAARRAAEIDTARLSGEGRAHLLNLRAWIEVCREGDATRAREWAEEANRLWPGQENVLHTLACARVAEGRDPGEADLRAIARTLEDVEKDAPQERCYIFYFAAIAYARVGARNRSADARVRLEASPGGAALLERLDRALER